MNYRGRIGLYLILCMILVTCSTKKEIEALREEQKELRKKGLELKEKNRDLSSKMRDLKRDSLELRDSINQLSSLITSVRGDIDSLRGLDQDLESLKRKYRPVKEELDVVTTKYNLLLGTARSLRSSLFNIGQTAMDTCGDSLSLNWHPEDTCYMASPERYRIR